MSYELNGEFSRGRKKSGQEWRQKEHGMKGMH